MTRIDFYILPESSSSEASRENYACRITEKAYQLGHHVYLHSESEIQSKRLDELLWSFRPGSFIPHALDTESGQEAVTIGHAHEPMENTDVLINLANEAPVFFSRFERVAEIVDGSAKNKEAARQRFRFYRDRGYELNHHHIQI
jgi:DNA polymerase-3 subunit chi